MTRSKLQAAAAFLLLAGLIPAIAAYESSLVNVTSHIVQPPPPSQNHTTAAGWANFQEDGYMLAYHPSLAFEGEKGNWDHTRVFTGEVACWEFALTITNTYSYEMGEVVIFDKYGAMRLDDGTFLVDVVDVYKREPTGGQILKRPENPDSFTAQIEFTWYPGLDIGELGPADPGFRPSDSELAPGEVQSMTVTLCTKQDPSFDQAFTSPGRYQLNEGATFSWLNPQGQRFNSVAEALTLEAIVREVPEPEVSDKEEEQAEQDLETAEEQAEQDLEMAEEQAEQDLEMAEEQAEQDLEVVEGQAGQDLEVAEEQAGQDLEVAEEQAGQDLEVVEGQAGQDPEVAEEQAGQDLEVAEEQAGQDPETAEEQAGQDPETVEEQAGQDPETVEEQAGQDLEVVEDQEGQDPEVAEDKAGQDPEIVEDQAEQELETTEEQAEQDLETTEENAEKEDEKQGKN